MLNIYNSNGLMFWNEQQIALRNSFVTYFVGEVKKHLLSMNSAWHFEQVEATILTPFKYVNQNYTRDDIFSTEPELAPDILVMRPETTMGSYEYAKHLLNTHNNTKIRMPLVVWQAGKSFRNELDLVTKNMRLKEFYQLEFQCIYSTKTANDYYTAAIPLMLESFVKFFGTACRIVDSDRLPDYSERTVDIEIFIPGNKWMELCSISKRKDFDGAHVLEIAIGLDRLLYAFENRFNNGQ